MATLKSALAASTAPRKAVPVIDAAAAEAERSALAAFVAAIIKAIRAIARFVFGGTWTDLKADLSGARKAAGTARSVGDHALAAAGRGLEGPGRVLDAAAGAVGSTLGALLPVAPVGPRQVADAAVAYDRAPAMPAVFATPVAPQDPAGCSEADARNLQAWARCARKDDAAGTQRLAPLSVPLLAWLNGLDDTQLLRLEQLPASRVLAHVLATTDADRTPLLPPAHGIRRLDAGITDTEVEAIGVSWGIPRSEQPAILARGRARRTAREEAYEPATAFAL